MVETSRGAGEHVLTESGVLIAECPKVTNFTLNGPKATILLIK